jgi:hypothetical protein
MIKGLTRTGTASGTPGHSYRVCPVPSRLEWPGHVRDMSRYVLSCPASGRAMTLTIYRESTALAAVMLVTCRTVAPAGELISAALPTLRAS